MRVAREGKLVSCSVSDVMLIVAEIVVETSVVVSVCEMVPVSLVMFGSQADADSVKFSRDIKPVENAGAHPLRAGQLGAFEINIL